ncbi:MAG: hypothetical protein ACKO85_00530 [Isosphaeraceae bacterium]
MIAHFQRIKPILTIAVVAVAGCSGDYKTADNQAIPTEGARKGGPVEDLKDVNIDNEAEFLKNQNKKSK